MNGVRRIVIAVAILAAHGALAQAPQVPRPFAPIDETLYREWIDRIKKAPWEQADPVMQVLGAMEREAQQRAVKPVPAKP